MATIVSTFSQKDKNTVDLFVRLVGQKVVDSLGELPILKVLTLLTSQEDYINGVNQYLYKELPTSSVFDPSVNLTIGDFNPTLTKIRESVKKNQKLMYVADKLVIESLLRAFANPKAKATYINRKRQDLFNTMKLDLIKYLFGTILQGTDKLVAYDFDETVDTKTIKVNNVDELENERVLRVLKLINKKIKNLEMPKKRAKWVVDNAYNILHSASPNQLILFVNSAFEIEANAAISTVYHYEKLLPKSNIVSLDFSEIAGVDDKLDCLLIDKRALVQGTWIKQISADIQLLKFSKVFELAYSINLSRIEVYPIISFAKSA